MMPVEKVEIPDLGIEQWFMTKNIVFVANNREIVCMEPNDENRFRVNLRRRNNYHAKIRSILSRISHDDNTHFMLNGNELIFLSRDKCILYFAKLLERIFRTSITVETKFLNDSTNFTCDLHLLDLYEMGYWCKTNCIFNLKQATVFTGLFIYATKPYDIANNQQDFIEFGYSGRYFSLKLSFGSLLLNREFLMPRITKMIMNIIHELPFDMLSDDDEILRLTEQCTKAWTIDKSLVYGTRKLNPEWSPYSFLSAVSKLMNIFEEFSVSHEFVVKQDLDSM